jgi:hypothetical protein
LGVESEPAEYALAENSIKNKTKDIFFNIK